MTKDDAACADPAICLTWEGKVVPRRSKQCEGKKKGQKATGTQQKVKRPE